MSIPLRLRAVSKRYRIGIPGCGGVVSALRNCSLDLHAGEFVGLLGRAGSGKSTLLLCAAGLLRPDSGSISWFGARKPPFPHDVVFVPEHASHHRFLTVRETLEHAVRRDLPRRIDGDHVGVTLEGAGLSAQAHQRVGTLGRGEAVRLTIARALLGRPRLLLLDETLSRLDGAERAGVEEVLSRLPARSTALLVSSGDPRALARLCSRVVRLDQGEIRGALTATERRAAAGRGLELELEMSCRTASLVRERLGGVPLDGSRMLVPLDEQSCEEALSLCRAMGVGVRSSRVVEGEVRD